MEDKTKVTIVEQANKAAQGLKDRLTGEDRKDYLLVEDLLQLTDAELRRVSGFARMASLFLDKKGLFGDFNQFVADQSKAQQNGGSDTRPAQDPKKEA